MPDIKRVDEENRRIVLRRRRKRQKPAPLVFTQEEQDVFVPEKMTILGGTLLACTLTREEYERQSQRQPSNK